MKTTTVLLASTLATLARSAAINSTCLLRRDGDDFDTEVEIGDNSVTAQWSYLPASGTNKENHPYTEAFTDLFDHVYDMCGPTQCGLDKSEAMQYCTAPINPDIWDGNESICLKAMGSFGSASKDDMFKLGRAAFDGSVKRVYDDTPVVAGVTESGVSFIHLVTGTGHNGGASGFDLTFNLYYQQNNEGCGAIVERINQAGSIVAGDFAPVFGLVGLVCDLAGSS